MNEGKAIVAVEVKPWFVRLNTPTNPSGKVFSRAERRAGEGVAAGLAVPAETELNPAETGPAYETFSGVQSYSKHGDHEN